MLVEVHGLRVLLVHGELGDAETLDPVLKEPPADSPSADDGVEEEHLQAAVRRRVLGLIFYTLTLSERGHPGGRYGYAGIVPRSREAALLMGQ